MTIAGDEAISIQVMFVFKSSSKSVTFILQQRFRVTERCCDCMKLCKDHFCCVFYRLAVKVITLPLLPPRPFRNHHTMPFSSSRGSKASQRCISHGKLSISADEMATWKTSPNRSPSLSLSTSWIHTAALLILFSLLVLLKLSMKCIITTKDFCTISAFCLVKRSITISILWA